MPDLISATSGWSLLLSTAPLPSNLPGRHLLNFAPATLPISWSGGGLRRLLNPATRPTRKHLPVPAP
ncbi:MAG: hypothetical protein ACI4X9_05015 [Kiritimatiellia bacterium]